MPTNAAGGVVWRPGRERLKVAVIHRPRYDDWTLPKGKVKHGECTLAAAVREVREETGLVVTVEDRLATLSYETGSGPKDVTYWSMRAGSGSFEPSDEVDEMRWMGAKRAARTLSYADDRQLLDQFFATPRATSIILLARHTSAGKRAQWHRPDHLRPLDGVGRRDARNMAELIAAFGVEALYAAGPVRCWQTAEPVGEALRLQVQAAPELADDGYAARPERAVDALHRLAATHPVSYVCSQGLAIPGLLTDLKAADDVDTRKGSLWVLGFDSEQELVFADYYRRPTR
ncbi:MAG: NUDIX hydrolase [Jatrophihabitans sp.]